MNNSPLKGMREPNEGVGIVKNKTTDSRDDFIKAQKHFETGGKGVCFNNYKTNCYNYTHASRQFLI